MTAIPQSEDEHLFRRFREAGDRDAFRLLFERTAPRVVSLGIRLGIEPADIDDLVQETYSAVLVGASRFDASRRVVPWVLGIAHKKALQTHRRALRRPASGELPGAVDTVSPSERLEIEELRRAVNNSVARLSPRYREIVELHYLQHMSVAAIADALGRRPSTVRTQIARGVSQLQRLLPRGMSTAALLVFELDELNKWLPTVRDLSPGAPMASAADLPRPPRPKVSRAARAGKLGAAGALAVGIGLVTSLVLDQGMDRVDASPRTAIARKTEIAGYGADGVEEPLPVSREPVSVPASGGPSVGSPRTLVPPPPGATVRITLLNRTTGQPVPHAAVGLQQLHANVPSHLGAMLGGFVPGITDASGNVVFRNVEYRRARVRFGESSGSRVFEVEEGIDEIVLVGSAVTVRGTVRDDTGQVVPGAEVWCSSPQRRALTPIQLAARCDDQGHFETAFVESDRKMVWARAPGRVSECQIVRLYETQRDLSLRLEHFPCRVRGTVLTSSSQTSSLVILYSLSDELRSPPLRARTGPEHAFDIGVLIPGDYVLAAVSDDGRSARRVLDIAPDEEIWCELRLEASATVEGHVRDTIGRPLAGVLLMTLPKLDPPGGLAPLRRFARTAADGSFRVDSVPPGPTTLMVTEASTGQLLSWEQRYLRAGNIEQWTPSVTPKAPSSDRIASVAAITSWCASGSKGEGSASPVCVDAAQGEQVALLCTLRCEIAPELFQGCEELFVKIVPVEGPEFGAHRVKVTPKKLFFELESFVPDRYEFRVVTGSQVTVHSEIVDVQRGSSGEFSVRLPHSGI